MKLLYTCILLALYLNVSSQQSIGGLPLSFNLNEVNSQEFQWVEFPAINIDQVQLEDYNREQTGRRGNTIGDYIATFIVAYGC